jgi:dolichol-phosphate mannosyltransferase
VQRTLVIPTYQEAENIRRLLETIRDLCPDLHVIVCDDNSPDGTGRIADEAAAELGGIEVLHRPGKAGLGAAYRHGFRHALDAHYEVIIQMDADFSHDPSVLPALITAVDNGADVAIGSRYVPGGSVPNWTWLRRQLSQWGNSYARAMLRLEMADATTAFRAYRATALQRIDIDGTTANGYLFQIETAYRLSAADLVITELPIVFVDRVAGASKMAVVRTMVETELRVTWWGLALRAPRVSERLRQTAPGKYLMSKIRPSGPPIVE